VVGMGDGGRWTGILFVLVLVLAVIVVFLVVSVSCASLVRDVGW